MDDTTRRVGRGDEFRGRADEPTRNYASTPDRVADTPRSAGRTSETSRTERADSDLDPESERRTREIQGEIAHTRAELSETIDALQDKLSPSNMVSDATDRVKTATTERMRSMADTASDTAQGVMEEARHNAIPALMIGAGVAWMLIDRSRHHGNGRRHHAATQRRDYSSPTYGAYAETEEFYDTTRMPRRNWSGQRSSSESIGTWARDAGGEARHTARRAQNGLQRMMRQNPLLVGAAAMLVGAAVGASLPETEKENEWMGETRDSVVDKAQEAAENAASAVKEATNDAVGDTVDKVTERVTGAKRE